MDAWVHDFEEEDMFLFDAASVPFASAQGKKDGAAAPLATGSAVSAPPAAVPAASAPPASATSASANSASATSASASSAAATPAAPTGPTAAVKKRILKRMASQPAAPKARNLTRRPSLGKPSGLQCMNRLCLWGENVRVPCVVHPLVRRDGKLFFPVHEQSYWLRRACGDKGLTHWTDRFQQAVSELRRTLKDGIRETVDRAGAAVEKAREALGLQEEDGAQASAVGATKRRKRGVASAVGASATEEVGVMVNGVLVKVRVRERPFEIEATAEAVMAVVGFCQTSLKRGKAAPRRVSTTDASRGGFAFKTDDCPAIVGKVTWHPSVEAWCVHFKDAQRKDQWRRVPAKRHEPRDSFLANVSAANERGTCASQAARRMAYLAALRLWDELDCSSRERIGLPPTASAPVEAATAPDKNASAHRKT